MYKFDRKNLYPINGLNFMMYCIIIRGDPSPGAVQFLHDFLQPQATLQALVTKFWRSGPLVGISFLFIFQHTILSYGDEIT